MDHPLFIILGTMVVAFAVLGGMTALISKLDLWLMQRQAPVALKRRPPVVKRLADDTIEIVEFSSARWDQIPALLLAGFIVAAILILLPLVLTQSPSLEDLQARLVCISGFLVAVTLLTLSMRSRHTYYQIELTTGKVQKQVYFFGIPRKPANYLLKLPVTARSDCQYKNRDRQHASLRYATCWTLAGGKRRLVIIHKDEQEAEQFRANLAQHGCPILGQSERE